MRVRGRVCVCARVYVRVRKVLAFKTSNRGQFASFIFLKKSNIVSDKSIFNVDKDSVTNGLDYHWHHNHHTSISIISFYNLISSVTISNFGFSMNVRSTASFKSFH